MSTAISIILIAIFLFLSGIHIYWAFGGHWGKSASLPANENNINVMTPGIAPTLIVALGLLIFASTVFINAFNIELQFSPWLNKIVHRYALWVISSIFILRAVGEFKYVGLFKKIRKTKFGRNDTKYYTPLCLIIGILTLILELN